MHVRWDTLEVVSVEKGRIELVIHGEPFVRIRKVYQFWMLHKRWLEVVVRFLVSHPSFDLSSRHDVGKAQLIQLVAPLDLFLVPFTSELSAFFWPQVVDDPSRSDPVFHVVPVPRLER